MVAKRKSGPGVDVPDTETVMAEREVAVRRTQNAEEGDEMDIQIGPAKNSSDRPTEKAAHRMGKISEAVAEVEQGTSSALAAANASSRD